MLTDSYTENMIPTPDELDEELGLQLQIHEMVKRIVGEMRRLGTPGKIPPISVTLEEFAQRTALAAAFYKKGWLANFREPTERFSGYAVDISRRAA